MSSSQARGRSPPPVHKSVVVQYLKDRDSTPFRPPLYSPYPSTGHSSVDRVVFHYETPPLLSCLQLVRAFTLSTSRACNEVHVGNGSHRTDTRPTSGRLTLHQSCNDDIKAHPMRFDIVIATLGPLCFSDPSSWVV